MKYGGSGGSRTRCITLTPEFHADIAFWTLNVRRARGSITGRLGDPLETLYHQPHSYTLVFDASGAATGGYCLERGHWWRLDFDNDVQQRVRVHIDKLTDLYLKHIKTVRYGDHSVGIRFTSRDEGKLS